MAEIETVKASTEQAVINGILERDGCVVIEGVLNARQVETLAAELAPHFDEAPNCQGDFYGYVTKRLSGLIALLGVDDLWAPLRRGMEPCSH